MGYVPEWEAQGGNAVLGGLSGDVGCGGASFQVLLLLKVRGTSGVDCSYRKREISMEDMLTF